MCKQLHRVFRQTPVDVTLLNDVRKSDTAAHNCRAQQCRLQTRIWEAADSVCLQALPFAVEETRRQRLRIARSVLGSVLGEAQSAIASMLPVAATSTAADRSSSSGIDSGQSPNHAATAEQTNLAVDLRNFASHMGAIAGTLADASEAEVVRHGSMAFRMSVLGDCLLRSTAQASRSTGPAASAATALTLADLLRPPLLLEIATGQLTGLSACDCRKIMIHAGSQQPLEAAEAVEACTTGATAIGCSLAVLHVLSLQEGQGGCSPPGADEQMAIALQGAQVCMWLSRKL